MTLDRIRAVVLLVALVAALAVAPVAPEAGNTLFLCAGGSAFILLLLFPQSAAAHLGRPVVWMPLLGLAILGLGFGLATRSLQGALGLYFFAPILTIYPLLCLSDHRAQMHVQAVASLCLCGVGGAAAVAFIEFATTGTSRAGATIANPIHFADVALTVGFLALIGAVFTRGAWRFLYLSGPALGAVAVLLSGTRGAVLAFAAMTGVALALSISAGFLTKKSLMIGAFVFAAFSILAVALGALQTSGIQRVLADIADVMQTGMPTDLATAERLQMYQGGIDAFLASPLVGYGPFDYVAAAAESNGGSFGSFSPPHLHNDIIDFAVSGGVFGVAAYLLILLAPLVEALRAQNSANKRGVVMVASTITFGYFVMGLTNAMFGVLTITVVYAAAALVVGLARGNGMPDCSNR